MITAIYAGLCGLMLLVLSARVIAQRAAQKVDFGDGGSQPLQVAIRVQANFVEYVPMALILIYLAEVLQHDAVFIHGLGIALVASRILHAWGLSRSTGTSAGRFIGTLGTWIVIAMGSVMLLMGG